MEKTKKNSYFYTGGQFIDKSARCCAEGQQQLTASPNTRTHTELEHIVAMRLASSKQHGTETDALPLLKPSELKGLRIDAAIENPVTGETKWTDVSIMHTSAATYIQAELKSVGEKATASNIAATFQLPDYLKATPSPSLLKREVEKNFKYSRLITVAQKQAKDKKRLQCPSFASFIVSDFGDLSPAAIELQEWIVAAYAKKCVREGARPDGCNKVDMIRSFRQKFKLNVQLAVASGFGYFFFFYFYFFFCWAKLILI